MRTLIAYDAFSILYSDPEARALRHLFSIRYDQRVNIDNVPLGKGITGAAAESREAVRVHDTAKDPRYIASHPDIRSEVAVPLILQDRVLGVMDLESSRVGHFTDDHVRTLSLLAPQVASSVENARLYQEIATREERRMEEDLQAARELQRVLIPDGSPEITGAEACVRLRPAREISGDIYDVFELPDGKYVIAFGDVSGKGTAAALYGGLVSGLLRTLARRRKPAELMQALNDTLGERKVDARYVTLCVMLWDPISREIVMANAGAIPPMICRGSEILNIRVEGVPLGLLDDREYEEVPFQAQSGDTLLYSDGITDHLNAAGTEFGHGRLAQIIRHNCSQTACDLNASIFHELDRFSTTAFDDQTVFIMKVL